MNETKLGNSFPESQFYINGFRKPFRFDRNENGEGVMIYVRKDIPCKQLNKHRFKKNIEAIFVELNFRKRKFLLIGSYHSTHSVYGCSNIEYFSEIEFSLDIYSKYDKFLIAGDLNIQEKETPIKNFLDSFKARNLVRENTCFKNLENPSCIDLFLTNSFQSFIHTTTVCTGLSDFHKMIVTVLKTTFPKAKSNIIAYRDFSKFSENDFQNDLKRILRSKQIKDYDSFEKIFLNSLNIHAPCKKKVIRANQKPYVTKQLRKAIMHRSYLENKLMKHRTEDYQRA